MVLVQEIHWHLLLETVGEQQLIFKIIGRRCYKGETPDSNLLESLGAPLESLWSPFGVPWSPLESWSPGIRCFPLAMLANIDRVRPYCTYSWFLLPFWISRTIFGLQWQVLVVGMILTVNCFSFVFHFIRYKFSAWDWQWWYDWCWISNTFFLVVYC